MDPRHDLAAQQLARMRGMVALYHRQFFSDIRFSTAAELALFALGFWIDARLFLAIPVVALIGANQTAFDASYLMFARHYARALERVLNREVADGILVAADLEDAYLFRLDETKVVTLGFGGGFTWFGWMTAFYSIVGVVSYVYGLVLGLEAISGTAETVYLAVLGTLTLLALVVGAWWFVRGEGERRLGMILEDL